MKRLHIHVGVEDLGRSVAFYSSLFGEQPTVAKPDYAKWMLEDPRVNFAISSGHASSGVEHLGIEAEDPAELALVYGRLTAAEAPVLEEGRTTCCYAKSEKSWVADPDGLVWEAFRTSGEATVYGDAPDLGALCCDSQTPQGVCCEPKAHLQPDAACCG